MEAAKEAPLYEGHKLRVIVAYTGEDHWMQMRMGKDYSWDDSTGYLLQHDVLRTLAPVPSGELERKLDIINPFISPNLKLHHINMDEVHEALSQAYTEEEKRRKAATGKPGL